MKPYFNVGEEVILCSKNFPQYSGDYIIRKLVYRGLHICRITGKQCVFSGDIGYILDADLIGSNGVEAVWRQSALRKKHKPSGKSFSEIINSTNPKVIN